MSVSNQLILGHAHVHFELSTLPEHQGTQTFVLRIAKILKPVNPRPGSPAGTPAIREGSLLPMVTSTGELKPWTSSAFDSEGVAFTQILAALPLAPHGEFNIGS